jgi:light-regulated signal transduction histidine kinase (bacteriophytochrome)
MSDSRTTDRAVSFAACEHEPIHLAGSIQPHGFLLAVSEATGLITQASANVDTLLGREVVSILGKGPDAVLGAELAQRVRMAAEDPQFGHRAVFVDRWSVVVGGETRIFVLLGHRHGGHVIIEGEALCTEEAKLPVDAHYQLEALLAQVESARGVDELLGLVAKEVRRITGFDRALVYRFDPDWHGRVIAEDRNEMLPSYLGLHFPASDVPRQARELYRLNRLRLIANANYQPVPLCGLPGADTPLDLSLSTLRSVAPVHREYMRNMGTGASFSISLIRDGELWGLISCHHREPRQVAFAVRTACGLLGQVLSLQLAVREQAEAFSHRMRLQAILTPMVSMLASHERLIEGIEACRDDLLRLMGADGAAVIEDDRVIRYGCVPAEAQIMALAAWLGRHSEDDVMAFASLGEVFPEAQAYASVASGLLALSVSRLRNSWVLWFRREVVETVTWGGEPGKAVTTAVDGAPQLHPRKSFDRWRELVRARSLPWQPAEIDTAREFRVAVVDIVLRGAEKLARLTEELTRTNRELENFSYTVSHDLRAPFRHIRSYAELLKVDKGAMLDEEGRLFLDYVLSGAKYAGRLVDNIIGFSRMGRVMLMITTVTLDELIHEVVRQVKVEPASRRVDWLISPLPRVQADQAMIFRVFHNLLENAVKFTRDRPVARIEVWAEEADLEHVMHVRDNGVGFDETYKDKLFGMFQRLHAWEEFEGTGIGLASVRRIIARHGGRVWAVSTLNESATFSFTLPKTASPTNPIYA